MPGMTVSGMPLDLQKGCEDHLSEIPPSEGAGPRLMKRLCRFYQVLKEGQRGLGEEYLPGGEWKVYLEERSPIYQHLLAGDIEKASGIFRNFWRNELGPIVSQYAYYSDIEARNESKMERFRTCMLRDYSIWRNLYGGDPKELEVPRVGNPWGIFIDGVLVTPQALRFHNHALQISNALSDIKHPVVAEIGGGYGGMAYALLSRRPAMTYIDFDLPETLVIAAYYLLSAFPEEKILLYDPSGHWNHGYLLEDSIVLLPNYLLPEMKDNSVDLLLNAFSLSEMPYPTIAEYLRQIERMTRRYFLLNNVDREGVIHRGHPRTPCSQFPVNPKVFKQIYKKYDLYQGSSGDYREILFEKSEGIHGC